MCEAVSSQYFDVNSIFESLSPELEEGLQKIEKDPEFEEEMTRMKSVEVTFKILQNQQQILVSKTLYQHEWSWATFSLTFLIAPLGPLLYIFNHKHSSKYSRESTHVLVKRALSELITSETPTNRELISCSVRVNSTKCSLFFNGRYYSLGFKDSSKEILHQFTTTALKN